MRFGWPAHGMQRATQRARTRPPSRNVSRLVGLAERSSLHVCLRLHRAPPSSDAPAIAPLRALVGPAERSSLDIRLCLHRTLLPRCSSFGRGHSVATCMSPDHECRAVSLCDRTARPSRPSSPASPSSFCSAIGLGKCAMRPRRQSTAARHCASRFPPVDYRRRSMGIRTPIRGPGTER